MSPGTPQPPDPRQPPVPSQEPPQPSWGNVSDRHWSRARKDQNAEALEYYRERSKAPGVAEGGGARNSYCMHCDGVIPIEYEQFEPASGEKRFCPHCGAEIEARVRRMFNWVEIDQPHGSDLKAVWPWILLAVLLVGALVYFVV